MAKKISYSKLNASTIDILNVIRANASYQYQNLVPVVETELDIPKVGEVILGTPAIANEYINALLNRIALVVVKSATFNNPYAGLKKGYIEFGETVEEIFVEMAKARNFSTEKAAGREFKRTIPKVKSAFHVINWEVQYPVTVEEKDLQRAFLSIEGVRDFIAKIVDSVYRAAEYDEYLLFKYVLIKTIAHGKSWVVPVSTTAGLNDTATAFRGYANILKFPSEQYNVANVKNNTPEERINIFMDSFFNAKFDVEVLAGAFNMDKAEFIGRLRLIDNWGTFDNERFAEIVKECDQIEPITADELNITKNVKAVIVDSEFFQFYDIMSKFTETYVGSGMYWNYFYNVFKTISVSPFSNIITFVEGTDVELAPDTFTVNVLGVEKGNEATVVEIGDLQTLGLTNTSVIYEENEEAVKGGVGVLPYGVYLFPKGAKAITPTAEVLGTKYTATTTLGTTAGLSTTLTFNKD